LLQSTKLSHMMFFGIWYKTKSWGHCFFHPMWTSCSALPLLPPMRNFLWLGGKKQTGVEGNFFPHVSAWGMWGEDECFQMVALPERVVTHLRDKD
jgi:hypothetical protein